MGCGLRKEIEDMMWLMPQRHRLRTLRTSCGFRCLVDPVPFYPRSPHAATGRGSTKVEALKDLLERWRIGCFDSVSSCPAANREELELKLAVMGK